MSNVWLVLPSRNIERAKKTVILWREKGYKTCVWMEPGMESAGADVNVSERFPGYWLSCNKMILDLIKKDESIKTVVIAADDMEPDKDRSPEIIEKELYGKYPDGYCVMQPTGDDKNGMDGVWCICGSPWFGIGWIKEAHHGMGPCPYPYKAFYGDEQLFEVSKAQGVLWQRDVVTQFHHHWCRNDQFKTKRLDYQTKNSDLYWDSDQQWFMMQKAAGFPGCERKANGQKAC